jgi:hypothetical protein
MDADSHGRQIEFCCPTCLRSANALDTAKRPRCLRCDRTMEPDDPDLGPSKAPHRVTPKPPDRS